jgi:putative DNA primase/helicase
MKGKIMPTIDPANNAHANPRLTAALAYAAHGWAVFPLHTIQRGQCTCGKADCGRSSGKHAEGTLAPNGRKNASTKPDEIEYWWTRCPSGNVGIATGHESGIVVLDVDPEHGGNASLETLEAEHGSLPPTVQCRTGSGGLHVYFQHPGSYIKSSNGELAPGLDVKGDGGSVVAPPSLHLSGKRYAWVEGCSPDDIEVAPLPGWLLTRMQATGDRQGNPSKGESSPRVMLAQRIPESRRNDTLTSLAGAMRRRGMTEVEICAALLVANRDRCDPPLPDWEVKRIAAGITRYAPEDVILTLEFPLTELGDAQRLVARHGPDLHYVPQWGKWVIWAETHWVADVGQVERWAKETVLAIAEAARQLGDDDRRQKLVKHAHRAQSERHLRAMITLAKSEPGVTVLAEQLDADPWLLNVQNGTLDLRTGQLRQHCREDLMTKMTPIAFDPQARAPRWRAFLRRIFAEKADLLRYVQLAVGYTLSGSAREQCFFILQGSGANGKSKFLQVISAMLGDYARHTPTQTLLATNADHVRSDLARLQGARLVTASEAEQQKHLADALIKQLTGEDTIVARYLYQEYIEFQPTFKIWLAANDRPKARGDDAALWRRVQLIPFAVTIPPAEQDKNLTDKLLLELPGILAWAVEGCLAWQQAPGGLIPPAEVVQATEDYRAEMDAIGRFIRDRCTTGTDLRVTPHDLYASYAEWCQSEGESPVSAKVLGEEMSRRGYPGTKRGGVRYRSGLALRCPRGAGEVTDMAGDDPALAHAA